MHEYDSIVIEIEDTVLLLIHATFDDDVDECINCNTVDVIRWYGNGRR
jgi:hypothetical protein